MILVAIINHHDISADDILALPEIKKSKLTSPAVQGFIEHHGLVQKTDFNAIKLYKILEQ